MNVVVEARSGELEKALAVNSQERDWNTHIRQRFNSPFAGDVGDYEERILGTFSANSAAAVFMMPYIEGPAGSEAMMRLWGWRQTAPKGHSWLHYLIAEFALVAGECPGPKGPGKMQDDVEMKQAERQCDAIMVLRGVARVVAYGRGTNLPGFIEAPLGGCKLYSVDFKYVGHPVGMNCWLAKL